MTTSAKFSNIILCDDYRKEISKKEILVGIYAEAIIFPDFPAIYPLTLWGRLAFPEPGTFDLDFQVVNPEGARLLGGKASFRIPEAGKPATLILPNMPIKFESPGVYSFQVREGEGDWEPLISIDARKGDVDPAATVLETTALPPPYEQSPPAAPE